jgi:hypothetical protein
MTDTFRAVVIDPEQRTIEEVRVPAKNTMAAVRAMIPLDADEGLDHFMLADHPDSWDQGWVRDCGLANGEPIHAIKLQGWHNPLAGRIVLLGVDKSTRDTCDAATPTAFLEQVIDWLGLIKPETTWVKEENGTRAVVTYEQVRP